MTITEAKIKLKPCNICQLPQASTGMLTLRGVKVCANCYVQNKRMFMPW